MQCAQMRGLLFVFIGMSGFSGFRMSFSQNEKIQSQIALIKRDRSALVEVFDHYVDAFRHDVDASLASARVAFGHACLSYKNILEKTHDDMAQAHSAHPAATQALDLGRLRAHLRDRAEARLSLWMRLKRLVADQADPLDSIGFLIGMLEKIEHVFLKITVHDRPAGTIKYHGHATRTCPMICTRHNGTWTGSWACPLKANCVCNCRDNPEDETVSVQKSEL